MSTCDTPEDDRSSGLPTGVWEGQYGEAGPSRVTHHRLSCPPFTTFLMLTALVIIMLNNINSNNTSNNNNCSRNNSGRTTLLICPTTHQNVQVRKSVFVHSTLCTLIPLRICSHRQAETVMMVSYGSRHFQVNTDTYINKHGRRLISTRKGTHTSVISKKSIAT